MSFGEPGSVPVIEAGALEIRPASPTDAAAINVLLHELGYPSNTEEEVIGRLASWSARDDLLVLAATAPAAASVDGQRLVGVAALAVIPYFERPGNWGRVVALVVDARVRGLGVGRRLLAACEQAALSRDCASMEISSNRRRTGAHAFYRSLGYTDRCDESARFHKVLIPKAAGHG